MDEFDRIVAAEHDLAVNRALDDSLRKFTLWLDHCETCPNCEPNIKGLAEKVMRDSTPPQALAAVFACAIFRMHERGLVPK